MTYPLRRHVGSATVAGACVILVALVSACASHRRVLKIIVPAAQVLPATSSPTPGPTPTAQRWRFLLPLVREDPVTEPLAIQATATPSGVAKATKTPKPTRTPTLPWPETLASPPPSKIGIHVQWNNSPEIMDYVRHMKPRVVKSAGDLGFFDEVKAVSPQTVTIARTGTQPILDGDAVALARAYVAENLPVYLAHPAADYWEGPNEPDVKGRMAWYAAFEAERVRAMAVHGLKVAIGSFSAGVPEFDEFQAFLPAIREALAHGGILSLHEYDAPTLDRSLGAGLPGLPNHPDRGALALRYRWWYRDILEPQGLVIPLVISEVGVDGLVTNRPGPAKAKGWRDFRGYWSDQGLGADAIQVYINQLAWYDTELRKDPYVIGCAVFTAGVMDDRWASYDITDILRHIATHIASPAAR